MIVAGYVGALVLLFVLAVPVAFALAGTAILVTLMERGVDFNPAFMVQRAVSGIDNFMLLSVPFFIYAGKVMNVGRHHGAHLRLCESRWSARCAAGSRRSTSSRASSSPA
jgi:TRAP-type mannitol/chloroaromatic compound transport system permease large subunit